MRTIVLASASPRRKNLLEKIGLKFIVYPSNYQEEISSKLSPQKLVERLSFAKAMAVSGKFKDALVIAADTCIVVNKKMIGKPTSSANAKEILKLLSGKMHYVLTSFTIFDIKTGKTVTKSARSKVYFKKLSKKEIGAYVATKEPLDKAGAYGIQELGGIFVKKIEGDYFNVVGLPIYSLIQELKKFKVEII